MLPICGCSALPRWSAQSLSTHGGLLRRCVSASGRPSNSTSRPSYSTNGSPVSHPTRPLRQSASATTAAEASNRCSPAAPTADAVVCFYEAFICATEDVHLLLLQEAHRKHGVWLNVPPQLAPTVPNVGPPTIPEPLYPPKQQQRLDALARGADAARMSGAAPHVTPAANNVLHDETCLAYAPTHAPPPFVTTGTRTLWIAPDSALGDAHAVAASSVPIEGAAAGAVATALNLWAGANTTAAPHLQTTVTEVAIRAPVDTTLRFHCSVCGRGYRRREAAEAHVAKRHDRVGNDVAEAQAVVLEGPGPGEITGYKSVVGTSIVPPPSAALNAPPTAAAVGPGESKKAGADSANTGSHATQIQSASSAAKHASIPTLDERNATAAPATEGPTTTSSSSSASKPSRLLTLVDAYRSTPTVALPDDSLIDALLSSVWDEVGLKRSDIVKAAAGGGGDGAARTSFAAGSTAALDSCDGRLFIPSSCFVEGTADIRAELEAERANKQQARATPEGAAPGVKRTNTASSVISCVASRRLYLQRLNADGTFTSTGVARAREGDAVDGTAVGLSAAPTAQEMSIVQLSRHYPNPFGDSPNAALVEQEKEPVNPFIELEVEIEARMNAAGASEGRSDDEAEGDGAQRGKAVEHLLREWQVSLASRPYACPICQRRALPGITEAIRLSSTPSLPPTAGAPKASTTAAPSSKSIVGGAGGSAAASTPHAGPPLPTSSAVQTAERTPASPSAAGSAGAAPDGASHMWLDEEAWKWYASRVPRFRLLSALEDHIDSCHDASDAPVSAGLCSGTDGDDAVEEVTEDDWRWLYGIAASPTQSAEAELSAVRRLYSAIVAPNAKRAASSQLTTAVDSVVGQGARTLPTGAAGEGTEDPGVGPGNATGAPSKNGEQSGNTKIDGDDTGASARAGETTDAAAAAVALHVHVRSAVNTVLVGVVRDAQEGFVGTSRVLQYVLAVRNRDPVASDASIDAGSPDAATAGEVSSDDDDELIVVRCMGDLLPAALLHQQVHVGTTLFVAGTLRMNRNVDTTSRRSHAYPYVQVVPPLGAVRVVKRS
ncbi:putative RNA-editing complex protein MP81 [Leptomonas seymouri]|uniref:Putative RNA-editing complex protein MP81 n=1 Tax=Leptomonas seymouri TaxID=5684 RepID=A0A0N1I0H5_LEPSE|nr:putative RNA-editing complex protein MP81 [Leptomonas seymouri]|eukprot:KPI84263.1 putative RNA-editing complex protein MP81 [Leptomonas seymouri]